MIFCAMEGELHEIGIMASALIAIHHGYKIMYLGANLPGDVLVETANALDPEFIIISATEFISSLEKNHIEKYVHKLDEAITHKCKIIIGTGLDFQIAKKSSSTEKIFSGRLSDWRTFSIVSGAKG